MVGSGLSMGRTMKVIVSGARGCGKTSILEKVIYDNNGVRLLVIALAQWIDLDGIISAVLGHLGRRVCGQHRD